ncbi:PDZ domain-containing protein [bacterium]|nr:MAG: PDZ domain-containing protein [bacterium]
MPVLAALLALGPQTGTIDVPFYNTPNAIVVDAVVNGRPVSLMFDTGFSGTVVLSSSVDVGPPTGKMTLRDFVGQLEANTVKLKSLQLGAKSVPIDSHKEIVQQAADFSESYGRHVDGILGLGALKDTVFTIDFERGKFIFRPNTYDITKLVPDNKKTFLQKLLPIGHSSLEMFVTAPNGKNMTLALDTGNAFYATTHRDVLERIGLWEANKPHKFAKLSGVASGAVESWSIKMPELTIFGVPTPPSVWDIIDLPSSSAEGDGTVGHGFLKNFNITIDYPRRRVWLEKFKEQITNTEEGDVGISAGYDPRIKRTVIYRVTPDSPADLAGIKEGDHVLMVDGDDLVRVGYVKFRNLMEGKIGSTVRLAISHNGALKRVELKRAALVNGN